MRRVSVMFYILMMVVLTNAFSGMVSAFLVTNPFEQIKTFQQLLETDSHITVADGYGAHGYLKRSNDSLMKKVLSRLNPVNVKGMADYEIIQNILQNNTAFIDSKNWIMS